MSDSVPLPSHPPVSRRSQMPGGQRQFGDLTPCPECGPEAEVVEDRHQGTCVCTNCGLVVEHGIVSDEAEWRNFGDGDKADPSRVGGPETGWFSETGLSTVVQPGCQASWAQLQNRSAMGPYHRRMELAWRTCRTISTRLSFPSVIMHAAARVFQMALKVTGNAGTMEAIIAVCLYWACIHEQVPRTRKVILAACDGVSIKEFNHTFKALKRLGMHKLLRCSPSEALQPDAPISNAGAPPQIKRRKRKLSSLEASSVVNASSPVASIPTVTRTPVVGNNSTSKVVAPGVDFKAMQAMQMQIMTAVSQWCAQLRLEAATVGLASLVAAATRLPAMEREASAFSLEAICAGSVYLVTFYGATMANRRDLHLVSATTRVSPDILTECLLFLRQRMGRLVPSAQHAHFCFPAQQ